MPNLGKRAAEDDEGHDDMQEPLAPRRSARLRRSSTISSSTSTSAAASTSSPSSPSTASISTVASLSTARTSPSPDLSMPPPQSTQSLPRKIRLPAHNGRRISIVIAPGSSQSLPWEISGPRPVGVPIPPIPLFQPTGLTDRPPRQKPRHRASFVAPAATEVGPSTPTPSPRPVQEPPRRSLSVRSISPDVKPQHVLLNPYSYFPPEPTTSGVWHVPTHEIPAQCQRTHTSHHENRRVWVEEQKRWICARGFASGLQVMSAMFMSDGFVMDWKTRRPVYPTTLLPPILPPEFYASSPSQQPTQSTEQFAPSRTHVTVPTPLPTPTSAHIPAQPYIPKPTTVPTTLVQASTVSRTVSRSEDDEASVEHLVHDDANSADRDDHEEEQNLNSDDDLYMSWDEYERKRTASLQSDATAPSASASSPTKAQVRFSKPVVPHTPSSSPTKCIELPVSVPAPLPRPVGIPVPMFDFETRNIMPAKRAR